MFGKKGMYDILRSVPDFQMLELEYLLQKVFRYRAYKDEEYLYYASADPKFEVSLDFYDGRFDFAYNDFVKMEFIHYYFNVEDGHIVNIVFE